MEPNQERRPSAWIECAVGPAGEKPVGLFTLRDFAGSDDFGVRKHRPQLPKVNAPGANKVSNRKRGELGQREERPRLDRPARSKLDCWIDLRRREGSVCVSPVCEAAARLSTPSRHNPPSRAGNFGTVRPVNRAENSAGLGSQAR